MYGLATEASVVGLVLAACLALVTRFVRVDSSAARAGLVGFAMGVAIHLGFELSGANAWYCTHGAACNRDRRVY